MLCIDSATRASESMSLVVGNEMVLMGNQQIGVVACNSRASNHGRSYRQTGLYTFLKHVRSA